MSTQPSPRPVLRSRKLAAAAFAGAIVTSTLGMPPASASPSGDLWNLINAKHVAAGCAGYGNAPALGDVALQYAKTMAANNGQVHPVSDTPTFAPNTENLLNGRGYFPTSLGEMEYFNPNGATPQDALNFWANANTRDLFPNCGLQQMETAVWTQGNNWAAVSLMGTPGAAPGPLPPGDQPR